MEFTYLINSCIISVMVVMAPIVWVLITISV